MLTFGARMQKITGNFERLVNEHKNAVYRQMVRVCSHREDAEDALAAALLQAFRSADQLLDEASFLPWLATIGKRICYRMRSHPAFEVPLEYADRLAAETTIAEGDLEVLQGCVKQAVEELAPTYRAVYLLAELEEYQISEVAAKLGISEAAVKSRLHRARAQVRERLDKSICAM